MKKKKHLPTSTHFTTTQMAQICKVSYATIYKWIQQGMVPATFTVGGHRRISKDDLVAFLLERGEQIPADLLGEKHDVGPKIIKKKLPNPAEKTEPATNEQHKMKIPDRICNAVYMARSMGGEICSVQRAAQVLSLSCDDIYELNECGILPGRRLENKALVFSMVDVFRVGMILYE